MATSVAVYLLQQFVSSNSDSHVPLLFVLAVLFISRFTDGYIYGLVASMVAVVGVNYVFTYPYFEFNFTITGYPLTFLSHAGGFDQCRNTYDTDQAAGAD